MVTLVAGLHGPLAVVFIVVKAGNPPLAGAHVAIPVAFEVRTYPFDAEDGMVNCELMVVVPLRVVAPVTERGPVSVIPGTVMGPAPKGEMF